MYGLNICALRLLLRCQADLLIPQVSFSKVLIGYHVMLCIGPFSKLLG